MPKRIQRQRKKGWRKPPNAVIVTRPFRWGNQFVIRPDLEPGTKIPGRYGRTYTVVPTAEDAVRCFREYMEASAAEQDAARRELRGRDVVCYCGLDQPCHADDAPCDREQRLMAMVPPNLSPRQPPLPALGAHAERVGGRGR